MTEKQCAHCGLWFRRKARSRALYCDGYCRSTGKLLWLQYKLTRAAYEALVEKQNGRCAICDATPQWAESTSKLKPNRLHVDHDHATGRVRGLLCYRCNRALSQAERAPGWLDKAKAYLRE